MNFDLIPHFMAALPRLQPSRVRETVNPESVQVDPTQLRLGQAGPNQILRYPLAEGRADAPQILAYLQQFAIYYGRSPFVREFVRTILPTFTRDNDQATIIRTLSSFVRDNIIYIPDPAGSEFFIDPIALINQVRTKGRGYGDCDDHVLLLNSMLNAVGFETRVVGVHLHDPELWDHVISSVFMDGRWMDIDPCLKTNEMPAYREKLVPV